MTDDEKFMALMAVLIDIRDALLPEESAESDECQHPDSARVDLSTLGDLNHWICSACRYEHRGVTHN